MEKKKFSGYKQAVFVFLISFCGLGLAYAPFSLYLPSVCEELGVSMSSATAIYSFQGVTAMIFGFGVASIVKKIGVKGVLWMAALSLIGCFALMFTATGMPMLYAAGALLGIGLTGCAMAMPFVIPNWFIEKQGTMLGICMAASGVGGFIGSPLATTLISSKGWRFSCMVFLIIFVVVLSVCCIFIKVHPSEVGELPLGYKAGDDNQASVNVELPGPTAAVAMKSFSFILMIITVICIQIPNVAHASQISNMMLSKGLTLATAGMVITIYSVFNTFGNVLIGVVNDKFGFKAAWSFVLIWNVVAYGVAIILNSPLLAVVFAVSYGLAQPGSGTGLTLLVSNSFGPKAMGSLIGIANGVLSGAGIVTPLLVSMLYESSGSYNTSCIIAAVCAAIALALGLVLKKRGDKMIAEAN